MEEQVIPISNLFNNRFDDFVNSFDEEDIIIRHQNRDIISLGLLVIRRNSITSYTQIEKSTLRRNRDTGHTKMGKNTLRTNKDNNLSGIDKGMNSLNKVTFDVNFLYQGIIIYNEEKKKITRL